MARRGAVSTHSLVLRLDEKNRFVGGNVRIAKRMTPSRGERRKHERLPLCVPFVLGMAHGATAVTCLTENISGNGFYCICPEPLVPGERLEVHILLPTHGTSRYPAKVDLTCQVRVVRVNSDSPVGFGVGFEIESYTLSLRAASAAS